MILSGKRQKSLLLAGMLVACLPGTSASGDVLNLVSSDGVFAIDAFVREDQPSTAFDFDSTDADNGTNAVLQVDNRMAGASSQAHGLIAFDSLFGNGANQIPLGSTINSATLSLWLVNDNANNNISMYTMDVVWTESVTWNSIGGGIIGGTNATLRRTENWGSADPVSINVDVTSDVANWSSGASNFGWGFINSNNNGLQITATENTTGTTGWHTPILNVDFTPIPETEAWGILGALLLGLGIQRWRLHST